VIARTKRAYAALTTVLAIAGAAMLVARWWPVPDLPGRTLVTANPVTQAPAANNPFPLRLSGELSALKSVDVKPTVAGRLSAIRVKTGEHVRANSIVAVIEPVNRMQSTVALEAALQSAQDDWTKKKERLDVIERELARAEELVRADLIARRDMDQANAQADTARAQLRLAEARVAQQRAMLAQGRALDRHARIVAPIAGVVVHCWLDVGATVNESTAILTIADVDRLKLIARRSARDAMEVHAGMTALLTATDAPEKAFSGKIVRVSRALDTSEETEIEIQVTSKGELRPGMVVEARIESGERKLLKTDGGTTTGEDSTLW
jgi:RND family efflux transporter MFP subunit